ncbi:MAG: tyrosine/phenylalanine carboxypeptidase domain-containing protein [Candidatus Altimarinota bacterium]
MWFFKNYGILGQNARNLKYIGEFNDDLAKKLADSKIKTKEFLANKGVKVSENLAIIKSHDELDNFDMNSLPLPFVVKPNAGYGGKGIIVFDKKDGAGNFISNDNQIYSPHEFIVHVREILDGFYSLSGSRDKVIFERKLNLDHSIELLGKYGLPDIRVIVFNSVPVIAMLRVPTANSKGKANLHGGACGLGIDIGTGRITYITQFKKMIKSIPGIGDVRGIEIPHWEDVLRLAVKVQQVTGVGYVGCDIVLDDTFGPLLLEMNVRPGLEVQVANKVPLLERLKKVENIKVNSVEKGVRLARDLFGGDIEEKIKNISGKKVVGNKEYIEITYNDKTFQSVCEIKTNKPNSYIHIDYLINILKYPQEKIKGNIVKLKCSILGETRTVKFHVKPLEVSNMILGKEALYGFLVDPFKYKESDLPYNSKNPLLKEKNIAILKGYEEQLLKLDKEIMDIDKKLNILKIITPKNISSEKLKFIESKGTYIPQLEYNEINFNVKELFTKITKIEIPDIPLSGIFKRKKDEVINKLYFIQAFQDQNIEGLNYYGKLLYGEITKENLEYTTDLIINREEIKKEKEFLTIEEIKKYITKFNYIYNINIHLVEKEIGSRFSVKGDSLLIKNGSLVGKKEMRSVVAHEIETHYLRKINGLKSKYSIFAVGTSDYLITEEGLAIYNQGKFVTKNDAKYYGAAERYCLIDFGLKHSYKEFVQELIKTYNYDYGSVFNYLARLKRGVKDTSKNYIFLKDIIYINGFLQVKKFIENGGNINELYFGKISLQDLAEIKKSEFIQFKVDDFKIPLFT